MTPKKSNPWIKRMRRIETRYGLEAGNTDSEQNKPPIKCTCGSLTWFKPTVGAYVCPGCGKVGLK